MEEAQQAALEQLGAGADEVEFEVLQRPGALLGIFGRAGYTVRAVLREEEPETGEPEATERAEEAGPEVTEEEQIPHQDLAQIGCDFLQQMLDCMGIEGTAEIAACTEDEVRLNASGENMGLLIGRHGATLDAIQLIVAIAANRQVGEGARVIVDAEDYRERHRQMLMAKARRHADEAKRSGQEVVVPHLKAYERRVMHMALKDDAGVATYSEGEGDERVFVISPR